MADKVARRGENAVLLALASGSNITEAARAGNVSTRTVNRWMNDDPAFTVRVAELRAELLGRTVSEIDARAWAEALDDIPLNDDARAAVVQHYRETHRWIMPADVRHRVKAARERCIARQPVPAPPAELTGNTAAYKAQLGATVEQIANRRDLARALIPPPGTGTQPSDEYRRRRAAGYDPTLIPALNIMCPWEPCKATVGRSCTNAAGRPLTRPHDGRLVAAGLARWVEVNGVRRAELIEAS